jgi:adenosylcobyric acid synthase
VLPYLHGLHLEAEDALNMQQLGDDTENRLKIVVPVLPRISNHTDFDPLRQHPQLDFQFVSVQDVIPPADLIILPGSKSVADDLAFLQANGWPEHLRHHLRYGGKVMGICGGFQMLGQTIKDPRGVESSTLCARGLGLLALQTTLAEQKTLSNVTGYFRDRNTPVSGYEIHAGVSEGVALTNPAFVINGMPEGAISADGQILGTYLHGVFESPEACQALMNWAGLDDAEQIDYAALRERGIDRLADAVEQSLDTTQLQNLIPELTMKR